MGNLNKRLRGIFTYLIEGYKTLNNWPQYFTDLVRFALRLKTKCTTYKLRNGTIINIHPDSSGLNFVFYEVYLNGEYNKPENFTVNKNDVVIDIGAHLGFFTIKSALNATNGTIYAFEPFSMHFNILKKNIEQNSFSNVKLFHQAVGDRNGEMTLFYTMDGDPGDTSMYKIGNNTETLEEKVESITLNELFSREKIEICNFMKLDCEGAEYSILFNTDDQVLNKIQRIAMEWHRFTEDHDPKRLADFLTSKGFRLVKTTSYDSRAGLLFACR